MPNIKTWKIIRSIQFSYIFWTCCWFNAQVLKTRITNFIEIFFKEILEITNWNTIKGFNIRSQIDGPTYRCTPSPDWNCIGRRRYRFPPNWVLLQRDQPRSGYKNHIKYCLNDTKFQDILCVFTQIRINNNNNNNNNHFSLIEECMV